MERLVTISCCLTTSIMWYHISCQQERLDFGTDCAYHKRYYILREIWKQCVFSAEWTKPTWRYVSNIYMLWLGYCFLKPLSSFGMVPKLFFKFLWFLVSKILPILIFREVFSSWNIKWMRVDDNYHNNNFGPVAQGQKFPHVRITCM